VVAAEARREGAAEGARGAEREARPDLMLLARLQDDRGTLADGRASGTAGLFLRWGLYDPQRAARREAARTASAAAEAEATAARDVARFEIETAWHRARSSRERWLASSGGTEEGREALRVVRERRAAGLATLTDELETEAAALAAELDELAAAADAAIARAALERAAGASPLESPK
jgi:outer membrane protein TolC